MLTGIGIDQYGTVYKLKTHHPRKELLERFGVKHADKMYIDTNPIKDVKHIGYIISGLWIQVYQLTEWEGGKL